VTPPDKNNQPLDAILRRTMRWQPGPATPECADSESLAAYSDRSLSAAERERLEAHFADCMRCQSMLADIARADESARSAGSASYVPWYRKWRVAIPALAAVSVVVLSAIRRPGNDQPQRDQLVAMAKREASRTELAEQAPALATVPAPPPAAPALSAPAPASNEITMNEPRREAAARAEAKRRATLHRMAESATAPGARAMTAQAGAAPASVGAAVAGGAVSSPEAAPSKPLVTIPAPDQSVVWLAGRNGTIERRDAGGATHLQRSGANADLVAGAAPSATVCWIVGRSGTVIRTTDGEHWAVVTAPTADDLVAVSASSGNDAAVTTAGGNRFTTSDGGASWHQH